MASFDRGSSDGIQRGNRSGSGYASDGTGSNGPAAPARNATGCAPTQSMPQQGTIEPQGTAATDSRAEPLSDKLARSDGVLCPPTGVDPEIRAPTPKTGNMPVIPPPGSTGGDPTIRPK
jgi:hypothetical protein